MSAVYIAVAHLHDRLRPVLAEALDVESESRSTVRRQAAALLAGRAKEPMRPRLRDVRIDRRLRGDVRSSFDTSALAIGQRRRLGRWNGRARPLPRLTRSGSGRGRGRSRVRAGWRPDSVLPRRPFGHGAAAGERLASARDRARAQRQSRAVSYQAEASSARSQGPGGDELRRTAGRMHSSPRGVGGPRRLYTLTGDSWAAARRDAGTTESWHRFHDAATRANRLLAAAGSARARDSCPRTASSSAGAGTATNQRRDAIERTHSVTAAALAAVGRTRRQARVWQRQAVVAASRAYSTCGRSGASQLELHGAAAHHLLAVELRGEDLERGLDNAAAQAQDELRR